MAAPVVVDQRGRRSDGDALEGHFARMNDGRLVAVEKVESRDGNGYPVNVMVRTRDARNELLSVAWASLDPEGSHGPNRGN